MRHYHLTQDGKIPVVAVMGPTASGKTALAIQLAQQFGGEIVSADSMQIYMGMDIATAKPTLQEMQGIPHHLIGFQPPEKPFSVAEYAELAHCTLCEILERGRLPILAGGTGLYMDAVLDDLNFPEITANHALREELRAYAHNYGNEALWCRLEKIDSETAALLHANNLGRIIRAIEVFQVTGIPMAEHQRRSRRESRYRVFKLGLNYMERGLLYGRINRRVDQMVEQGLLQEAEGFRKWRLSVAQTGVTSVQAIGYKELEGFFSGAITLAEALENLKRETRRYAKRQLTWFNRDSELLWYYPDELEYVGNIEIMVKKIISDIDNFLSI